MSRPFVSVAITLMLGAASGLASCSSSEKSIDAAPVDTEVDLSSPQSTTVTTVSSEPCAPSHLAADLEVSSLKLVDDLCDGSWAVVDTDVASASAGLALARDVDGMWTFAVTTPTASLCRDDLTSRGVPTVIVNGLDWSCDTFVQPPTLTADVAGDSFKAGVEGGRVGALQREFVRQGLLTEVDVDGQFGPMTRRAVLDYQLANGLTLTAEADEATLRMLGMLPAERTAAAQEIVISVDHLGDMPLGTEADTLIVYLTDLLGPADWEWTYRPDPTATECMLRTHRLIRWSGLQVYLFDYDTGLELIAFDYVAQPELGVVTSTGARIGDPLERWLQLYPGSTTEYSDGSQLWFSPDMYGNTWMYADLATSDGTGAPIGIYVGPPDFC